MAADTIKYLAYGSNMHPLRLQQRVPSSEFIEVVSLSGFQLHFHKRGADDSAKCNMLFTGEDADLVYAVVYKMRADERAYLDEVEGLGRGYELYSLEVEGARDRHRVFCYIADPGYIDNHLKPFDWYRQLVLSAARYHGFPVPYIQNIHDLVAQPDPNEARAELHYRLVDAL